MCFFVPSLGMGTYKKEGIWEFESSGSPHKSKKSEANTTKS